MAYRENLEWDFNKENAQKKSIGRSSFNKIRNHKGCTLPSDHLTASQKKKLNGEVITMNLNKPVRYAEFKLWPKDIQEKYMNSLHERFGATRSDIAKMFCIDPFTLKKFIDLKGLDIFPAHKGSRLQDPQGWENFRKGLLSASETPKPQTGIPASDLDSPEKSIDIPKLESPVKQLWPTMDGTSEDSKSFCNFATEFEGLESIDDVVAIIKNLPWKGDVKIRIEVTSN